MHRPLTILVIDPHCQVPFYNSYFCSALSDEGHNVELWSREPKYLSEYFSHRSFRVRKMMKFTSAIFAGNNFISKLIKYIELLLIDLPALFIRAQKSDVIHMQWCSPVPFLFFELWLYKMLLLQGKKIFFTAHNIFPHHHSKYFSRSLSKLYALMDGIFVTTEYGKQKLESQFLFSAPVCVLPHGTMFHDVSSVPQTSAKQLLGISSCNNIVLFHGFLRAYKGIEFLLQSFAQLLSKTPDAMLLIAGSGEKEYVGKLQALTEQLHLTSKNILMHCHYIPVETLPVYFSAADIVVFPYQHIYQSGALLTAIGMKKPVITTSVGGFPEIIENNVTGKLIEFGNVSQFAHAMHELLSSQQQRETFARNAFEKMNTHYSWKNIAQTASEYYVKIMDEKFNEY